LETGKENSNEGYGERMAQVGLLEDNARIAKMCVTMLRYVGHEVILYEHGRACLQALSIPDGITGEQRVAQSQEGPSRLPLDILILDLHLADIDGVEVLQRLRSYPHTRSLPLIVCTAATSTEIARALHIVPDAVLISKPFHLYTLVSAVSDLLEKTSK
jgi:CheY-like chemotaxis protein